MIINNIILCSHQEDVDKYNNLLIHKIFLPTEIFDITTETNVLGIPNVHSWLNDSIFNNIKHIAIKEIIMLTKKTNISKGVVNGAIIIIRSIEFDKNKIIISIIINFLNSNTFITLKRQTLQHKYTYEAYYYKTSFPIVPSFAITSHKAQGASIKSKVLIDIKN